MLFPFYPIAVGSAAIKNMKKNSKERSENDTKLIKEIETKMIRQVNIFITVIRSLD